MASFLLPIMSGLYQLLILMSATLVMSTGGSSNFVTPQFVFHDENWLTSFVHNVSEQFPHLTHLYSIGKSVQGRDLLVLTLGHSPQTHVSLRPNVKYIGNIHGNEVVGREMLIHLVSHLLSHYNTHTIAASLLKSTLIHFLFSMNPDGLAIAQRGDCLGEVGRTNAEGYDLNRNFPDYFVNNSMSVIQRETRAVMDWLAREQFVLSGSLHGGTLVANYPYDNKPRGAAASAQKDIPDDIDVFLHLAKLYSFTHATMHRGLPCPNDRERFPDGITSGVAWYLVTGGMQDYNYIYAGCLELTLEISCCKFPAREAELSVHWQKNRDALLHFLVQAHVGVKGVVRDVVTQEPVGGATVEVSGRLHTSRTTAAGEYWRLLLPGAYVINVKATGYRAMSCAVYLSETAAVISQGEVVDEDAVSAAITRGAALLDISVQPNGVGEMSGACLRLPRTASLSYHIESHSRLVFLSACLISVLQMCLCYGNTFHLSMASF